MQSQDACNVDLYDPKFRFDDAIALCIRPTFDTDAKFNFRVNDYKIT